METLPYMWAGLDLRLIEKYAEVLSISKLILNGQFVIVKQFSCYTIL